MVQSGSVPRRVGEHRHTVLAIDDDGEARRALKELLELHGYQVATASDGTDALAQLRGGLAPCLILLDLRMAGMNGWEFRAEQMRDPALRDLQVVVFSGDAQEDAAAADLGLHLYLRKPVDFERLFEILDQSCRTVAPYREDAAS
jgi:CheY-like chemotaxis protein